MCSLTNSLFAPVVALFLVHHASIVAADIFLSKGSDVVVSKAAVNGILMEEIQGFFGHDSARGRLTAVEELLRPMYASLPKEDGRGGLGRTTVRYALHRFFAQQHAWHLTGLEPTGGAWNETSPTDILSDNVPAYIQGLFEEHLGETGLGLHELAVLVVALEHIVKAETVARIETAYEALFLNTTSVLKDDELEGVLDAHQALYLLALKDKIPVLRKALKKMNRIYPGWEDTQLFVRDTQLNIAYAERDVTNPFVVPQFGFQQVAHVIERVNDQFGHFQDLECRQTRDYLLEHEYRDSGRMRLADFYALALSGDKRFAESSDYLRQIGALDESDPSDPRVIIANYMYGKNNCFRSSAFYSVCCLDECETLLGHLERVFAEPEVSPERVADAVSQLSSSSVVAPRNLSATLRQRLADVAQVHGGMVPLHGRLFAQFMHHAFPRECPHPHVSGTTNQITPQEYMKQTGKKILATQDELRDSQSLSPSTADGELLPWHDEEELLVPRARVRDRSRGSGAVLGLTGAVMLAAVVAMVHGLAHRVQQARVTFRSTLCGDEGKQFV